MPIRSPGLDPYVEMVAIFPGIACGHTHMCLLPSHMMVVLSVDVPQWTVINWCEYFPMTNGLAGKDDKLVGQSSLPGNTPVYRVHMAIPL